MCIFNGMSYTALLLNKYPSKLKTLWCLRLKKLPSAWTSFSGWRYDMETLSALLGHLWLELTGHGGFPYDGSVMHKFGVSFSSVSTSCWMNSRVASDMGLLGVFYISYTTLWGVKDEKDGKSVKYVWFTADRERKSIVRVIRNRYHNCDMFYSKCHCSE